MEYKITYKINEDATFDVIFNDTKIGKLINKDGYWWFLCNRQLKNNYDWSIISILERELNSAKKTFEDKLNRVIDFYNTLNFLK